MSFLAGLLAPVKANNPLDERYWSGNGVQTAAGVPVTADTALKVSAVWACVRELSNPIAWLPLIVYKRLADGGRNRATWNPIYSVIRQPNVWQTAMEFRKMLTVHALLRGNGLARILPGPRGAVDQLIPIHPDRLVAIEQLSDYALRYTVRKIGSMTETYTLMDYEVFHLRFATFDGIQGVSVIEYARETLGMSLATEQYAARYFSQNAVPSAVLVHPGKVNRDGRERIREEFQADMAGLGNAHNVAVMAEGIEIKPVALSNEDSQFLQTREFGVEEVARWFGVPLHKIQHNSKTTSWGSGVEEMNQDFITGSLMPLGVTWEQTISRDLIIDTNNYYTEFLWEALAKGRLLDRYQAFHLALTDGWLNRNEVRQMENHNRADGLDEFLYPANMVVDGAEPTDDSDKSQESGDGEQESEDTGQRSEHYRAVLAEAARRVVRKEIAALTTAARRAGEDFAAFEAGVRKFYSDHATFVAQSLKMPISIAEEYVASQQEGALLYGVPSLTMDESATVAMLCQFAMEGEHVLE